MQNINVKLSPDYHKVNNCVKSNSISLEPPGADKVIEDVAAVEEVSSVIEAVVECKEESYTSDSTGPVMQTAYKTLSMDQCRRRNGLVDSVRALVRGAAPYKVDIVIPIKAKW